MELGAEVSVRDEDGLSPRDILQDNDWTDSKVVSRRRGGVREEGRRRERRMLFLCVRGKGAARARAGVVVVVVGIEVRVVD